MHQGCIIFFYHHDDDDDNDDDDDDDDDGDDNDDHLVLAPIIRRSSTSSSSSFSLPNIPQHSHIRLTVTFLQCFFAVADFTKLYHGTTVLAGLPLKCSTPKGHFCFHIISSHPHKCSTSTRTVDMSSFSIGPFTISSECINESFHI